jgi:hypothetical protein
MQDLLCFEYFDLDPSDQLEEISTLNSSKSGVNGHSETCSDALMRNSSAIVYSVDPVQIKQHGIRGVQPQGTEATGTDLRMMAESLGSKLSRAPHIRYTRLSCAPSYNLGVYF